MTDAPVLFTAGEICRWPSICSLLSDFGAGAHVFFGDHVGLRADVRYFRELESLDDEEPITDNPFFDQRIATDVFNFWRGTIGITFHFGG